MNDQPKHSWNVSKESRIAMIEDAARELFATGLVDESAWRTTVAVKVAENCGNFSLETQVYNFMNNIGSEGLTKIRILCIGEEGEQRRLAKTGLAARPPVPPAPAPPKPPPVPPPPVPPEDGTGDAGGPEKSDFDDLPMESDRSRIHRIEAQYEEAIQRLAPQERTRRNLARSLGKDGKNAFAVDSYLFAHPELARRLIDGGDVFHPAFLQPKK